MKIIIFGGNGLVGNSIRSNTFFINQQLFCPTSTELNATNYSDVENYISKIKPDLVINSAGLVGGILINSKNHLNFLLTNLDIGKNILIASKFNNVNKLINLGTSCMYPANIYSRDITEEDLLTGPLEKTNEGYAIAKIVVAKISEYINLDRNFEYKTIIPCNLYGPNDKFDLERSHLIPAIINKIHQAKINDSNEVVIWGTGKVRREFMYSKDVARFIEFVINEWTTIPNIINLGLGYDYSVEEYYHIVSKTLNWSGNFIFDKTKPDGMQNKLLNIDKIKKLNWKTKYSLEQGIMETYTHYFNSFN
jgi:GDP-L-fucose synthase